MSILATTIPAASMAPGTAPRRWTRLGAGTPLYNALAVVLLVAISSFVVLSPTSSDSSLQAPGSAGGSTPSGSSGEADGTRALATPRSTTTSATPRSTTSTTSDATGITTTTGAVSTTTATTRPSTTTPPRTAAAALSTPATATPSTAAAPATTLPPDRSTTTTSAPSTTAARPPRCEDFATQPEAQAALGGDAAFDGDGDGLVCEQLPGGPRHPRCEDFASQPEAQAAFDADPGGLAVFDGDGDGVACEHLPGVPVEEPPPPPPPVPSKVDLLRPTTRFYGVHTREAPFFMGEVDQFAADTGKMPSLLLFFQTFSDPYPAAAVEATWNRGMLPMLSLEPIIEDSQEGQPTLDDIADGRYDHVLDEWAVAIRDQGVPVALRFAHEMNGDWYPWGERAPGNEPGDYVRAWQHLHDRFTSIGATEVIWVWSVNRVDAQPVKTVDHLYPGDDYVDWVGMGAYYRQVTPGVDPSFAATFNMTLAELRRVAPAKPIILTEVGAGTGEATRVKWIEAFFTGLLEHPEVFGFAWFNDIKSGGDWRIQYSAATTAAFAAGVSDARYGSGV